MARRVVNNSDPGDADHAGGDDWDYLQGYLTGTDQGATDPVTINTITTFGSGKLASSGYVDFTRIAAPGNPSANMGRFYVKQIDTNNDGLFILLKKAGSYVEVQIA